MSSDVICNCQSPIEKVSKISAKMIVIIGLLPNLLTYFYTYKGFYFFFNWRNFRFECTVFKIQKLRLYLSHTTDAKIDFHILYSTQRIFQSTPAPLRKAEDSIPKTSFNCFRTTTVSALTVFPSYCRSLCS
jgi:hypothetical protein